MHELEDGYLTSEEQSRIRMVLQAEAEAYATLLAYIDFGESQSAVDPELDDGTSGRGCGNHRLGADPRAGTPTLKFRSEYVVY